jgi:hypothetical protein
MRYYSVIVVLCLCAVIAASALAGCSRAVGPQTVTRAPDDEPYRLESEGQVPPPGLSSVRQEVDRIDVFEETPVTEGVVAVETVDMVEPLTDDALGDSVVTGPGFRVQVFATGSRESAESFEMDVETRLGVATYLERIDGIYKVRVGDCRSRQQAEDLRQRCRDAGYKDAWIVTTQVRWERPKTSP